MKICNQLVKNVKN